MISLAVLTFEFDMKESDSVQRLICNQSLIYVPSILCYHNVILMYMHKVCFVVIR